MDRKEMLRDWQARDRLDKLERVQRTTDQAWLVPGLVLAWAALLGWLLWVIVG